MGQKYAVYAADGTISAFYDSVDNPPPGISNLLGISDADWQCCIATQGYRVVNDQLVAPVAPTLGALLVLAQTAQVQMVDAECAAAIVSGFSCDALVSGTPYTYPAKMTDQANLSSSVLASLLPGTGTDWSTPFWCADEAGVWAYRLHTAAQIQAVGVCGKAAISGFIGRKIVLEGQIMAATSLEAVQAVVWS
ncbi:hypothetical protein [Pseudomonas sp. H3(2019)]|uniref:DUF4376 domain-containing protein n=1 Tax=Pseudomonas sp. H3(2019) TaxID=2598724 RepID=UPI00119208DA|nr:hypothetical protein [Pseudomonas sp. H3(2019)]TVT82363.1 hypothetical protein FPT12_16155 [Pseudomonas sp. H3(2019)]